MKQLTIRDRKSSQPEEAFRMKGKAPYSCLQMSSCFLARPLLINITWLNENLHGYILDPIFLDLIVVFIGHYWICEFKWILEFYPFRPEIDIS